MTDHRLNLNRALIGVIVVCIIAWVIMLIYVANRSSQERERLCLVLYALINRSGESIGAKGSPGYAYYRDHPDERRLARAQNRSFLEALPCKPKPEPPPLRTNTR